MSYIYNGTVYNNNGEEIYTKEDVYGDAFYEKKQKLIKNALEELQSKYEMMPINIINADGSIDRQYKESLFFFNEADNSIRPDIDNFIQFKNEETILNFLKEQKILEKINTQIKDGKEVKIENIFQKIFEKELMKTHSSHNIGAIEEYKNYFEIKDLLNKFYEEMPFISPQNFIIENTIKNYIERGTTPVKISFVHNGEYYDLPIDNYPIKDLGNLKEGNHLLLNQKTIVYNYGANGNQKIHTYFNVNGAKKEELPENLTILIDSSTVYEIKGYTDKYKNNSMETNKNWKVDDEIKVQIDLDLKKEQTNKKERKI